jgi:hypothetical protein
MEASDGATGQRFAGFCQSLMGFTRRAALS